MKNRFWLLILLTGVGCIAFGCAALKGVPQGSVLLGVYEGTFNGTGNEGSVEVKLYRAPDGSEPCFGNLGEGGSYLNFSGEIRENELTGQILLPLEGTLSGKISSDGKVLSGTYKFTVPPFDHGTWRARKK